jgi:hypothetical protein
MRYRVWPGRTKNLDDHSYSQGRIRLRKYPKDPCQLDCSFPADSCQLTSECLPFSFLLSRARMVPLSTMPCPIQQKFERIRYTEVYRDLTGLLSTPLVSVSLLDCGRSVALSQESMLAQVSTVKPPSPARVEIPSLARDREWLAAALSQLALRSTVHYSNKPQLDLARIWSSCPLV